ncbi:ankyrin repeat domain-containing protein [Nonomuraea sp. NPDC050022]|uniref:ankyrin repeat domain-containing protein n=1 Tax=Nonomuraea sp. NPDC050022 TaxID=3364358 RepID=UPI00379B76F7
MDLAAVTRHPSPVTRHLEQRASHPHAVCVQGRWAPDGVLRLKVSSPGTNRDGGIVDQEQAWKRGPLSLPAASLQPQLIFPCERRAMSGDAGSPVEYLSSGVLAQLKRLHGHIPEDFEPREWIVTTPVGEYPVPPSVQALLAVVWPAEQRLRTNDEFEWETLLYYGGEGSETEPGLVVEDRAWYTVGEDSGQWFLLVDLAEAATAIDPLTYRVDHEGCQSAPVGVWLSNRLSELKRSTAAIEFGRACAWGDVEAVRAALEGGIGTGPLEQSGLTPLHLATFSGSVETVRILLDADADPNTALADETAPLDIFSTYFEKYRGRRSDIDPLLSFSRDKGDTPLHFALRNLYSIDHIDGIRASLLGMVRLLLADGAQCTFPNEEYSPADIVFDMTVSMSKTDAPEVYECLELLYDAGAELVAYAGWTPDEE